MLFLFKGTSGAAPTPSTLVVRRVIEIVESRTTSPIGYYQIGRSAPRTFTRHSYFRRKRYSVASTVAAPVTVPDYFFVPFSDPELNFPTSVEPY